MLGDDLSPFLAYFGVTVRAGAITSKGILDMPSEIIAGGMVITTDYSLTCKTADFGGLLHGDPITVDGVNYEVREVKKLDDGKFCQVFLMRVS